MVPRRGILILALSVAMVACSDAPQEQHKAPTRPARYSPPTARSNPDRQQIRGEAFLKLPRGIEFISGLRVSVYGEEFIREVEDTSKLAEKAERDLPEIVRRIELLKDTIVARDSAVDWVKWIDRVSAEQRDFNARGYDSYPFFDPFDQKVITLSMTKNLLAANQVFDDVQERCKESHEKCKTRFEENMKLLKLDANERLEEALAEADANRRDLQAQRGRMDRILVAAAAHHKPVGTIYADSKGQFRIDRPPAGNYAIVATYSDPEWSSKYCWFLQRSDEPALDSGYVVLTQQSAAFIIEPPRPTPTPEPPPEEEENP